jgi:hypothetical protein
MGVIRNAYKTLDGVPERKNGVDQRMKLKLI